MSIRLNVTDEQKKRMANLNLEARVLNNLLEERKAMMDILGKEIMTANGLSVNTYNMFFSVSKDTWEATLKPSAITIPAPGTDLSKIKTN